MEMSTNLAVLCLCLVVMAVTCDPVQRAYDDTLTRLLQKLQGTERHQRSSEEHVDDDSSEEHDVTVDDIMGAMQKRSQLTSGSSMRDVMKDVVNSYRRMEARATGRDTDPKNCQPNPCAHGEKCSTTDLMTGTDYTCYNCKKDFSGTDCGVYDACFKKRAPPSGGGHCKTGELCIPSSNLNGYFCF